MDPRNSKWEELAHLRLKKSSHGRCSASAFPPNGRSTLSSTPPFSPVIRKQWNTDRISSNRHWTYSDSKNPFNVCLKHSVWSVMQSGVGISLHTGGVKRSIYPWLQISPWVMWFGPVAVEIWAIWNANTIERVCSLLDWIGYLDVISTWYSLLLL